MKILLPVDGSSAALAGVRQALALRAAGLPASFVLVNVQEPPSLYEVVVAHDAEVLSEVRRAAGAELLEPAEALLEAAGAEWEAEVAGGDPGNLLLELLENYGCEAVVVGLGAGSHVGGVAMALLEHSPVPVMVVREPGGAAEAGTDADDPGDVEADASP